MPLLEPPRARPRLGLVARLSVVLLLFWNPLSLALITAAAWTRLARYGAPAWGVFVVRVAVVIVGMLAARLLLDRDPAGRRLAAVAFAGCALVAVLTAITPYFPSNAVPSTKWPWLAAEVALDLALSVAILLRGPRPATPPVTPSP